MGKRAVLYTRVSTNKKEQEKSLDIQENQYKDYCERKGYELIKIYKDVGTGTSVRERPDFIQMMLDAGLDYEENNNATDIFRTNDNKEPKFDLIIVKDASRFSRNTEIGISTVNRLKDKEVAVIFENADLKSTDASAKQLMHTLFSIAEIESENMSKRIKFSKKYNAENKIYNPARLPYGYERNEKNEIVVNPEQRKIVELIYNNYPQQGSHILSQILNETNVPTQQGNKWSNDKITRIIRNKIYTGTAVVNRSSKKNVTDTKRYDVPEDEWIPIPNAVPPIISIEQWEEANKIRESRINKSTKKGRKPSVNDIYYSKIYCENCGSRFVRHIGVKDKINYMCQNRRKAQGCTVRGISISNVSEVFDGTAISSLMDGMANHAGYNELIKRIETEKSNLDIRRNALIVKIEKLEEEKEVIVDSFENKLAGASKHVVASLSERLDKKVVEINELESQKEKININSIIKLREKVEGKKLLIEGIRYGKAITKAEKLELLKQIVVGDYEIAISFSFPNFEDEILEFNSIFPMAEIQSVKAYEFRNTQRRNHKEARGYWADVDESRMDYHDFYHSGNEYLDSEGDYWVNGRNVGKDAIEMEKILDSTNK